MRVKKIFCSLLVCQLLLVTTLMAKVNRDSLIAALSKTQPDTNRVKILIRLCSIYRLSKPEKGIEYGCAAVMLSRKLGNEKGIIRAYEDIRVCYLTLGKVDSGIIWFKREAAKDKLAHYGIAIGTNYKNLSVLYEIQGNADSSISYALQAIQIMEKLPPSYYLALAYNNLANLYTDIDRNYSKAIEYYLKEIPLEQNNKKKLAETYVGLGNSYQSLNEYRKEIAYGLKAIRISDSLGEMEFLKFQALSNLGYAYMALGQNEQALNFYKQAEKIAPDGCSALYNNLANALMHLDKYGEARKYLDKAMVSAKVSTDPLDLKNIYFSFAEYMGGVKQFQEEARYLQLYLKIADSIAVMDKNSKIQEMETKFETKNKEAQIKLLGIDKALRDSEIKQSRILNYSLAGGGTLLVLLALVLFIGIRQKQKINVELIAQKNTLQLQKDIIEARDKEKELLLRELNHRVKNNLQIVSSLLSLQSDQISDSKSKEVFREGQSRVDAMSLIHQRLYLGDKFSKIDIREYLQNLVRSVSNSYGYNADNFKLDFEVEKIDVDVEIAIPLGLIINEILSNCFKHAFKSIDEPRLRLALQKTGETLDIKIADNGAGIEINTLTEKVDSFGMKMVNSLIEQICGTLKVFNNKGSNFEFLIPLDKNFLEIV